MWASNSYQEEPEEDHIHDVCWAASYSESDAIVITPTASVQVFEGAAVADEGSEPQKYTTRAADHVSKVFTFELQPVCNTEAGNVTTQGTSITDNSTSTAVTEVCINMDHTSSVNSPKIQHAENRLGPYAVGAREDGEPELQNDSMIQTSEHTSLGSDSIIPTQVEAAPEEHQPEFDTVRNQLVAALTTPLPEPILPAPKSKTVHATGATQPVTRSSSCLKAKLNKKKPVINLAQEVLAKKWGITIEDEELNNLTLQQYLDIYRKPLSTSALQAIRTLTNVATMKKIKKKKMSNNQGVSNKNKTPSV